MISLAHLQYKTKIKEICDFHPKLLYFICFWRFPAIFPIKNIIDKQEDCKSLSRLNITNYKAPYERSTHKITYDSCNFTPLGEFIVEELVNENICETISTFFKSRKKRLDSDKDKNKLGLLESALITNAEFELLFYENYTFDELSPDPIDVKYSEIKQKYNFIDLPKRGYISEKKEGHYFKFDCNVENEIFFFVIAFYCKSKKPFEIKIREDENHFYDYTPYEIICVNCKQIKNISPDFFYFM